MSRIFIHGLGVVSPAGWGLQPFRRALDAQEPPAPMPMERPGWKRPLLARRVPEPLPAGLNHPRLRRCSSMSLYAAAAAKEALADAGIAHSAGMRLGIVFCVTGGCVQFSRRFYDETLRNPATASPLLFPETVFNAPASHLGAILELDCVNYTLVGDPGAFLQALVMAAQWLQLGRADTCLVVGAEESDWVTADACRQFARQSIGAEGAAAIVLSAFPPVRRPGAELIAITDSHLYLKSVSRMRVIQQMRAELPDGSAATLLCDSREGTFRDQAETEVWKNWPAARVSPRMILGDGLMAAAGWQCVAAIDALRRGRQSSAIVSAAGGHQQAIGAFFSGYE